MLETGYVGDKNSMLVTDLLCWCYIAMLFLLCCLAPTFKTEHQYEMTQLVSGDQVPSFIPDEDMVKAMGNSNIML